MNPGIDKPFIVQSDFTILAESDCDTYEFLRNKLCEFAELVKTPGRLHMYRMTKISLWNAASKGMKGREIIEFLARHSKFTLPQNIRNDIYYFVDRYGIVKIVSLDTGDDRLYLYSEDRELLMMIRMMPGFAEEYLVIGEHHSPQNDLIMDEGKFLQIRPGKRGMLKRELIRAGIPVQDTGGFRDGEYLNVELRNKCLGSGKRFELRDYQQEAIERFLDSSGGGNGVVVLPCGAGKTVVGIGVITRLKQATLILTTNVTSVRQWIRELLDKTSIEEQQVGEYSGSRKDVRQITVATYQILTHRGNRTTDFPHMKLFQERDWGLIIYDEVHLLPAPVFRETAKIQAIRRLGLTATLVREDGLEEDVFALIGPKCYDRSWKALEEEGWISRVKCTEIRVPLDRETEVMYIRATNRSKNRIASENRLKLKVLERLLHRHAGEPTLIIGQYLDQLRAISALCNAPIISGEMSHEQRDHWYEKFRRGDQKVLVVSKVANFAVDLPDASVAIQVSGSFGSRQEEAQRLGRILRPKRKGEIASFYSLVSDNTREQEFAYKRRLFLAEQGYEYEMAEASQWMESYGTNVGTPDGAHGGAHSGTDSGTHGSTHGGTPNGTDSGKLGGIHDGTHSGTDSGKLGGIHGGTPNGTDSGTHGDAHGGTPNGTDRGRHGGTHGGTPSGSDRETDSGTHGGAHSGTDSGMHGGAHSGMPSGTDSGKLGNTHSETYGAEVTT